MKWLKWRETKWGSYTFALCAAVLFYILISHLNVILGGIATFVGYFTPVIYGVILAYIMDFLVKYIERLLAGKLPEKPGRIVAVGITVAIVILLFVLLTLALIPSLVKSITDIISNWGTYERQLSEMVQSISKGMGGSSKLDAGDISRTMNSAMGQFREYYYENSSSILEKVTSAGSQLASWVLAFIIAIYFLFAKKELLAGVRKIYHMVVPEAAHARSHTALARINVIFSKYIVCEVIDSLIVGSANAIFMLIARMPYVALISVVVGVTNLAPTFGPIVGALIGAFILILVKPFAVIPFFLFTIVIQTVDGYVIKPKFYGSALSVPSVWVLVAIIVLGRMFGVAGILLAIPIAAIITYMVRDLLEKQDEVEDKK
ncbi:MAG: AI-2E family transporter [Lachnospiraceae bacterium]|nr:AI-2E family transporter [Lachnospiraceae bacterium]MCR4732834.1 AI-2E family transporter [Lachnospiraceae bacterium]